MPDNKTVLIVDDSKVSRMMITAIIKEKQPEWTLLESSNADETRELAKANTIDFFSIDLNMPGKDGLELIDLLKRKYTDAKFALLTANIQEHTHESAKKLGAICINKPITEKSISEMLDFFND